MGKVYLEAQLLLLHYGSEINDFIIYMNFCLPVKYITNYIMLLGFIFHISNDSDHLK